MKVFPGPCRDVWSLVPKQRKNYVHGVLLIEVVLKEKDAGGR